MARPLTKFGELKKVMKDTKLSAVEVDVVLQKAIDELKLRIPSNLEGM